MNSLFLYQKNSKMLITKVLPMVRVGREKPRAGAVERGGKDTGHVGPGSCGSWRRDPSQGTTQTFTCILNQVTIKLNCRKVLES